MKNYILRYGIAGGLIHIALGLSNWLFIAGFSRNASQTIGWISILLSFLCIPLGIKYFRDKLNDGKLGFVEGLKIGLGITTVFSVVTFLYSLLFFIFAWDNFLKWQKKYMSPEELQAYEAQLAQIPDFIPVPVFHGVMFFLTIFVIGCVINLISTLILRKK